MTNRFKGLDLIECLKNYGQRFMILYRRQGSRPSPRKRNAKVGSQETPGVTGEFGLGIWNEAGQRLIEFCQENALVIANTLFPTTQEKTLHVDITQMANNEIRLIIFFAAKDGEALYSQQKQDRELTVAQIMNSLLPNSDLN